MNVDTAQINHIELCAGYGGIHLGLARAIPALRIVAYSEIEAFACANLVAKMETGHLDPAPIWTNLKSFPWASFRGKVHLLSGGYPCQPFSAAGKRGGSTDPRHLWPYIADGIAILRPLVCFFENVEGHITLGLSTVISDLEELGYKATWGIFSAAEVGAPHQRKRVFILAYRLGARLEGWPRLISHNEPEQPTAERSGDLWPSRPGQPQFEWEPPRVVESINNRGRSRWYPESEGGQYQSLGNSKGDQQRRSTEPTMHGQGEPVGGSGGNVANTMCQRRQQECGSSLGNETTHGPEGWNEQQSNSHNVSECNGQIVANSISAQRWTESGLADDGHGQEVRRDQGSGSSADETRHAEPANSGQRETESTLGRNSHGNSNRLVRPKLYISSDSRIDELRLLGNGCVPATVERAFRTLWTELFPA